MSAQKTICLLPAVFCLLLGSAPEAGAVRPLSANLAVAAGGGGRAGFLDGTFTTAQFNRPLGLALNPDSSLLYVADSGNHRIRVIHLDQDNEVTTLAGQDAFGKWDGPLLMARFNRPTALLYLPEDRLVVNDSGNQLLRLIDLKKGMVSTLAGGAAKPQPSAAPNPSALPAAQASLKGVRDMVYLAAAHSIFFTQPETGSLKRLDLNTHLVSTLADQMAEIPNPAALGCAGNKLYVADKALPGIYEILWKDNNAGKPVSIAACQGPVLSLSLNGGLLYALLAVPGMPVQRFFLNNQYPQNEYKDGFNHQFDGKLLSFRSSWGDSVPPDILFPPRSDQAFYPSTGFMADPSDIRKFYVARPDYHMVVSFRDLFGFEWNPSAGQCNSNGLGAPEYPAEKPKNTYRIILVGDSRSGEVHDFPYPTDYRARAKMEPNSFFPFNQSLAPQIERELNLLAALDNSPLNYEVFNVSRHGEFGIWPTYLVPDIVKRNDIDLVLIFLDATPVADYFNHPMTSEGIPEYPTDPEYLMKSPLDRIPKGTPRKLYDFSKAHDMVSIRDNGFDFDNRIYAEPELQDLLVELFGKPLDILYRKLSGMKTSNGQPVRFIFCNGYTGRSWNKDGDKHLWIAAAKKYNYPLWDLTADMAAVDLSFFPLTQDTIHMTADGCGFVGRFLAHVLIRDKQIPFKTKVLGE